MIAPTPDPLPAPPPPTPDRGFSLPLTPPVPSFHGHLPRFAAGEHRLVGAVWPPDPGPQAGDGPPRPGQPGPTPRPQPTGPVPHPPPPSHLPRSLRPAWRMATRPIELDEGPLYDALPKP